MKRLNVKLLAIVAIIFVVLTGSVVVVHGIQMNRNIDALLKRAEAAKKDDLRTALILFQRYRAYKPNDLERSAEFASLLADKAKATTLSHDYGAANAAMTQALTGLEQRPELKSTMVDLQHKLIDLNIWFHEFGQASKDLKKLKDKGQGDAKTDLQLAQCYINTVEYAKARELLYALVGYDITTKVFDVAKATAPHEVDAYVLLSNLLREKLRDEEAPDRIVLADRVIDQLVSANPESARAFLVQAEYLASYQSRDKARPAVEKALALAPEDAEVLVHATELALQSEDFENAEKYVKKGIEKHEKDDWRFYRLWAQIAEAQKNPEEAKKRLDVGLQAMPTSIYLLDMCFDQQIRSRDFEAAELTLKKLTYARVRPEYAEYAKARLLVAQQKFPEASQLLERLQPNLARNPSLSRMADVLLVQCYAALNQTDRMATAARRIPNTPEGQIALAIVDQAKGQGEKAGKRWEALLKSMEENNKSTNVAQLMLPLFQIKLAEQASKPKAERDWKEVDAMLVKLREQNAVKEPTGSLLHIGLLSAKGEAQQAQQEVDELLNKYPGEVSVLVRAMQLALQAHHADRALQIVDAAPPEIRNNPLLVSGRIEAQLMSGKKPDELKAVLNDIAKSSEKLPTNDRAQIDVNLGVAYLRIGDPQAAGQIWNQAAELLPHDPNIRLSQFNLARGTGDLAKMKEIEAWFEKESASDPAQVKLIHAAVLVGTVRQAEQAQIAANPQAVIALSDADKRNLATAKSLLGDVENIRPGWIEQAKLLADVDILEGRIDDAIGHLRLAITLGQPTSEVIKQLATLLHFRHRDPEAEQVLTTYGMLVAGDPNIERLQALVFRMNGKPQAALEKMQNKFNANSTDAGEHLLHGQMLYSAEDFAEAEAEFRKVVELAPDNAEGWLELIRALAREKKNEEALRTIQMAQAKVPEDRRAIVQAQGYEMLGDAAQAEQGYQSALSATPQSSLALQQIAAFYVRTNRADQAKKYLNQILASTPQTAVEKECYGWARRMTAELLAGDGKYSQFLQAIELLTPPDGQATPDDLYMRIALLFKRSDPNSSRQALRLLEELKKMRPLTWGERLNLAQLYERVGDWPNASDVMKSLLAEPTPDPSVYVNYIEMQLRRGTPGAADEASNWMQSLRTSGIKNTPSIAFLAARVASKLGRGPQAAAILLQLLPSQRPLSDDAWPTLNTLVGHGEFPGYLEQLEQYDAAEKLLHENLGNESQRSQLLAGFLARRGKIDQALDLIEQIRPALGQTGALHLAMVALSQNVVPPKPEQIQRVEKWFERALREDADSLNVQMELADLRSVERNWPEVEKIYRGVLKRTDLPDSTRAVVLNNMAFIIAMQGKNTDEAMKYITEAVNIFGPQSDMLDTRGIVHLSRNEVEQAVADLSDAVIVTDPRPIKFVHLAMAQTKAGDLPGARRSLDKAKELKFSPDDLSSLEKSQYQSMLKQLGVTI